MASGHRYSFEDAVRRRAGDLESEVEHQRRELARETNRRLAEIERTAAEELDAFEKVAAERTVEIHWLAAEHRDEFGAAADARAAELARTAGEQRAALEAKAASKAAQLDELGADRIRAIVDATTDALRQLEQSASAPERGSEARWPIVGREEARHVAEQVGAVRDVIRRRIVEFQEAVRQQTGLLEQLTRFNASASERLADARVTTNALRSGIEDLRRDVLEQPPDAIHWTTGTPPSEPPAAR